MTDHLCTEPLVIHLVGGDVECPDPECDLGPSAHASTLPCRWAAGYAHGRAWDGRPFPYVKCPGCRHIRRAGAPEALVQTQHRQRKEPA